MKIKLLWIKIIGMQYIVFKIIYTLCMFFLFSPEALTPASNPNQKASLEPPHSNECVILLADPILLQMPLEALQFLQLDNVISISRDFSLQMFGHRCGKDEAAQGKFVVKQSFNLIKFSHLLPFTDMS